MDIIPAIDLIEGRCVRLSQGLFESQKEYGDPLAIAQVYQDAGMKRLHLVDLDGAKGQGIVNLKTLGLIASKTKLVIDFGGGIKSREQLLRAFDAGATMVTCGSIAVSDPVLVLSWKEEFGPDKLIIGCDSKNGFVATDGWKRLSSMTLESLVSFYKDHGFGTFICTDITKDGMLKGPSVQLYEHLLSLFSPMSLIASGGVSSMEDVRELSSIGLKGVIIGKALFEGKITIEELASYKEAKDAR